MTIALPHRLHGVFTEAAKKASMPLAMYVVQMIEVAWAGRCGVAEAAPIAPAVEPMPEDTEKEELRARVASLEKELAQCIPVPAPKDVAAIWNTPLRKPAATIAGPIPPNEVVNVDAPPARKLAPAEVRLIKGLLAAGMTPREITKDYAYTAAQVADARARS